MYTETLPFLTIHDNRWIWLDVKPVGANRESVTHPARKWPLPLAPSLLGSPAAWVG